MQIVSRAFIDAYRYVVHRVLFNDVVQTLLVGIMYIRILGRWLL